MSDETGPAGTDKDEALNGSQPGPFERLLRLVDPVGFSASLTRAMAQMALHPAVVVEPTARFLGGLVQASAATTVRLVGVDAHGPVPAPAHDNRFADEAWLHNPLFYGVLQLYLLNSRLMGELFDAVPLPEPDAAKAKFLMKLLADAAAPSNYLVSNPKALRRAFDTGGRSLAMGWSNFLHDMVTNGGWPSQVTKDHFVLGKDMAATKGNVVFRNELIELVQYEATTPRVYSVPLLFCPPWINKYYIMDLAPGKSLVEWAVQHGFTVFGISYRNPDESMRDLSFEDYLFQGPRAAIDVVRSITGASKVNTLSVCLGGTLDAMLVAYLAATGENLVNSSTYLNTLVDFTGAGVLQEVFTDAKTVEELARRMDKRGYLEADEMSHTFDLLRANDLVFRYVAANWLMGETPPAFELLAWNNDSTRLPAKMHAYYLRRCWVDNALVRDEVKVAGTRLMVSEMTNDAYLVGAVNDHIVPWRANYRTTRLLHGDTRFVLTSGGHVAGIVNPPGPRAKMWVNEQMPADPDEWLAGAHEIADTWWNDWVPWLQARSGEQVPPPSMGNAEYPPIVKAPGTYVRG